MTISYLYQNQSTRFVSLMSFYQGVVGMVLAVFALPFNTYPFTHGIELTSVYGLIGAGVLGTFSAGFMNQAVQLIGPIMDSFIRTADVIVAYTIQIIFFHQCSDYLSITGAILIIMAIIFISIEDAVLNKLPDNHCLKSVL